MARFDTDLSKRDERRARSSVTAAPSWVLATVRITGTTPRTAVADDQRAVRARSGEVDQRVDRGCGGAGFETAHLADTATRPAWSPAGLASVPARISVWTAFPERHR